MSERNTPDTEPGSGGRRRPVQRILGAAARRFGRSGFEATSMREVAREAGVSKGLLHYYFRSKDHLLIEAQRATFRQLHLRFAERARLGDRGLSSALDALDAMWRSARDLREGAPFLVETLAMSGQDGPLREPLRLFYKEGTDLLEDGIRQVFVDDLDKLIVPPERMAVLIRILLSGLLVELAHARTPEEQLQVDQAYSDMRTLFERFVVYGEPAATVSPEDFEPGDLPLPW